MNLLNNTTGERASIFSILELEAMLFCPQQVYTYKVNASD